MKKLTLALAIANSLLSVSAYANNPITESINDEYVEAGDVLQIAIPVAGLAATWFHDDKEGAKQFVKSFASTIAIVQATKHTVGRIRPNTSNELSFPSGHTAAAFSGAAFLQSRYGAKWGVPAYALASYVGASRVYGNKHYADDVLAGASIAFLVNQYFISSYDDGLQVNVIPKNDGLAVGVSIDNSYFEQSREKGDVRYRQEYKHRFQLGIGFSQYDTIASATLDTDSVTLDETQIAAAVNYRYKINPGNYFQLNFAPNESRSVSSDEGGILTSLRDWSIAGSYQFNVVDNDWLSMELGAGVSGHYVSAAQVDKNNVYTESTFYRVLPTVNTVATVKLAESLTWVNKLQLQALSKDQVQQLETGLSYMINPEWEVGAKYQHTNTNWRSHGLSYKNNQTVLTVANYF